MLSFALFLAVSAVQDPVSIEHFSQRGGFNEALVLPARKDSARVLVGGGVEAARGIPPALAAELLAGLDAIALGEEELLAASANPALLAAAPFVCANVIDAGTGKTIAAPYRIRKIGAVRIAFVGITKPPAHGEARIPKGWTIQDPEAAIKALSIDADKVVLLAAMDRIEAAALLRKLDGIPVALVPAAGTRDPAPLALGAKWLVQSPTGQATLGTLSLKGAAAEGTWQSVKLSAEDRKRVGALMSKHGVEPLPSKLVQKRAAGAEPAEGSLEAGRRRSIGVRAANRALEVEVCSLLLTPEHGGVKAAEGRAWLVVETEWTNVLPMQLLFDRELPTAFEVQDFREILFLVGNGSRQARLHEERSRAPGGLLAGEFKLAASGSSRLANAVFDVPAAGWESLELRFYDFSHGHILLPLLGKPAPKKPFAGPAKNQAVVLQVEGFRELGEWGGRKAPEGFVFVAVDLLAASVLPHEVDASAFNPKAGKDARIKVASMGRWQDLDRHLAVVVDGEFGYGPVDPPERLLLPETPTGGEEAFLVPKGWTSLELRCDFPKIAGPGDPEPIQPAPLAFSLQGMPAKPKERKAIASAEEEGLVVSVIERRLADAFAGTPAPEGQKMLVLGIRVENKRKEGADVDPVRDFACLSKSGERIELHEATRAGKHPPVLRVPAGELRTFEVVFEVPGGAVPARLSWGEKVLGLER